MKKILNTSKFRKTISLIAVLALACFLQACAGARGGASSKNIEGSGADSKTASSTEWQGSNLSGPYPNHDCYQPLKPDRSDHAGKYMLYKEQLEKYRLCIENYAKSAQNDAKTIEQKGNSALREYRNFVTRP